MPSVHVDKVGEMAIIECAGRFVRNEAAFKLRDAVTSQTDARVVVLDLTEMHALAWIIHEVSSQKRKDALKGMMNTGLQTQHSLWEHPSLDTKCFTTADLLLLPSSTHPR
jgi:hypothetical protein